MSTSVKRASEPLLTVKPTEKRQKISEPCRDDKPSIDDLQALEVKPSQAELHNTAAVAVQGSGPDQGPDTTVKIHGTEGSLKPHQVATYEWVKKREETEPGKVVACGMGIGKTWIMLALSANEQPQVELLDLSEARHNLFVVPSILLNQMYDELDDNSRLHVLCLDSNFNPAKLFRGIKPMTVVMSYEQLRTHHKKCDSNDGSIFGIKWRRIILDEAHHIRSAESQTYEAVARLQGKWRWCLTGTPIYNRIDDVFPYLAFVRNVAIHSLIGALGAGIQLADLMRIRESLLNMMTRSTIEDFDELRIPPAEEVTRYVTLTDEEYKIYEDIQQDRAHAESGYLPAGVKMKSYEKSLATNNTLRQALAHPLCLVYPDEGSQAQEGRFVEHTSNFEDKVLRKAEDFVALNPCNVKSLKFVEDHKLSAFCSLLKRRTGKGITKGETKIIGVPVSSKMRETARIITSELAKDPKAKFLVYSAFRVALDLMMLYLTPLNINCDSVPAIKGKNVDDVKTKRNSLFQDFNNEHGPQVLLMTPNLGSVGLNLTAANHVIIMDPCWSPSMEDQAIGRAYRIKQIRIVKVWKLIAQGPSWQPTIDHRMKEVQDNKRLLIKFMLGADIPDIEQVISMIPEKWILDRGTNKKKRGSGNEQSEDFDDALDENDF